MTGRWLERVAADRGTATRAPLLREAAAENLGQWGKPWSSDTACGKKAFGL